MKKTLILGGVAALALSGAAIAQQADRPARGDTDGDGRISQAEFVQQRTARLAAMDANGDGTVSREEMQAARQARMAEGRARIFARMDADSDGSITRAEWDAAGQAARTQRAERGERRGGGHMMRGGRHGPRGGMMRLDRDGNGVTLAEAQLKAAEQFAMLDADRDGYVTAQERAAHREARQAQRAERRAARQAERSAQAE